MKIKDGHRIPCSNHPDRDATVIQYEDKVVMATRPRSGIGGSVNMVRVPVSTVRECIGAFCSDACAEGKTVARSSLCPHCCAGPGYLHTPACPSGRVPFNPDAPLGAEQTK